MSGGVLIVHGNTEARTGQCMRGGLIIVEGNAGRMTGAMMYGGEIIVCSDVMESTGEGMSGGVIYVGGEIRSLSEDAKRSPMSELDKNHLKEVFAKYDIKHNPEEFTKIIPNEDGPSARQWKKVIEESPVVYGGEVI